MATKTEMQSRIKQLEVEGERLAKTLELVRSQRDKANATITDRDETIEELQQRISELEAERQQLIAERDDIIDDARKDSAAYRKEIELLEQRYNEQSTHMAAQTELIATLEFDLKHVTKERDEAARRNDDLSIHNSHLEMELKKWSESYDEAHKEAVQLQMMLSTEKAKVENLDRLLERFDRDFTKAINACDDFLFIAFGMEKNHVVDNLEKLSQVQRFALCIKRILS